MPGCSHPVLLREYRNLASRRESTDLGYMAANVIDKPTSYQRLPLMWAIKEFAHRNRRGTVLPNLAKVVQIFRRERIFDEEHVEFFSFLTELHGLVRKKPFV